MCAQFGERNIGIVQCKWKECKLVFTSNRLLLNHIRHDHDIKNLNGRCFWEDCTFRTRGSTIRNHLKKHLDIIEAVCEICKVPRTFKWRFDLKKHLTKFHPGTEFVIDNDDKEEFGVHTARRKTYIPISIANILQ